MNIVQTTRTATDEGLNFCTGRSPPRGQWTGAFKSIIDYCDEEVLETDGNDACTIL